MSIPIVLQLTRDNDCVLYTTTGNDINHCLHIISVYLKSHLTLNIDYPSDYDEFECLYLENCSIKTKLIDYKIFSNNNWFQPWSLQEIYDYMLELINNNDIKDYLLKEDD